VILVAADESVNETARHVAELVRGYTVPVVFVTRKPPEVILPLVQEVHVRHPFIAGGGAWLYVPRGYFPGVFGPEPGEDPEWQALRLQPRRGDGADAVRLLMALYRLDDDPVLFVGLGEEWKHRNVLRAVDVPLIVRNDGIDQTRLLRTLPDVHLTTAAGPAGYAEAVFGAVNARSYVPEC
jgi:predicted mannosyl-3-phosphoglycerate phosphatase (HAD superfamily)